MERKVTPPPASRGDLIAGITVGIIAIPLAKGWRLAAGVPPQHYGSIPQRVAAIVIAY
ncbi:hypothetical protein LNP74_28555 [Klebsiella pneumoniae subsp. pneumoniae]|nr:hypothetical protein [Klebsiella pneumoniae subsp. pneumoniae]